MSPTSPRWTPSGFTAMKVRSVLLMFAGGWVGLTENCEIRWGSRKLERQIDLKRVSPFFL